MNFFRRLTADVPAELLAAQIATTSRQADTTTTVADHVPHDMPSTDYDPVFKILGALAEHPGVLTPDTPGLPAQANPTGEN